MTEPAGSSPDREPGRPVIVRRRFLRYILGFGIVSTLAMVVAPVVGFLVPPKSAAAGGSGGKVLAGTTAEIAPGSGKVVAMGSAPVIVTNSAQGVHAFSAVCTHLGCIVAYDAPNAVIACPCHGGVFNPNTGAVIAGPPPSPLKPVAVSIEKDRIYLVNS